MLAVDGGGAWTNELSAGFWAPESMNDLAVTYWKAGQPRKAIPLYEATLARAGAQG